MHFFLGQCTTIALPARPSFSMSAFFKDSDVTVHETYDRIATSIPLESQRTSVVRALRYERTSKPNRCNQNAYCITYMYVQREKKNLEEKKDLSFVRKPFISLYYI